MSNDSTIDYDFFMQQALRYLMRDVLKLVADIGDAPGAHHFYIEFLTGAPGVSIPDHLRQDYPERMTIVLQHMFQELTVDDESFAVTLKFKGRESRLEIPFDAVTSFADPSVEFGLRFEPATTDSENEEDTPETAPGDEKDAETEKSAGQDGDETDGKKSESAEVVSLDAFRKK